MFLTCKRDSSGSRDLLSPPIMILKKIKLNIIIKKIKIKLIDRKRKFKKNLINKIEGI